MRRLILGALLMLPLLFAACSSGGRVAAESVAAQPDLRTEPTRGPLTVPLSLHVAVEQGNRSSDLSSTRTIADLEVIATAMSTIWAQADVVFDPINVYEVEVPASVLQGILLGNTDQFFDQVNVTFEVQGGRAINGFYVAGAFGVNGFTPQGSNLFFVVDQPSVPDERVSSHEIGHIFGLRHDLDDPSQLMFSGTDGTGLNELEQTVARYTAEGLFPR